MALTIETSEVSEWYEICIEWLLQQSGLVVEREPRISGQTPDLLVTQPVGTKVVIECLVKLRDPAHQKETDEHGFHSCGGDIKELHGALYSRVEQKAAKYKDLVDGMPYVVAVYDMSCMDFIHTAMALAFSAHVPYVRFNAQGTVVSSGYSDQWSTPEMTASLFRRYPNVSGLIYSRWGQEHNFLPNPFADLPASAELFPFARIPEAPMIGGQPAWEKREPLFDADYLLPPNTYWGQVQRLAQSLTKLADRRRHRESVQP